MAEERVAAARHVDATIAVPGDKSISHRALIIGSLARGRSYIGNLSPAVDVQATARCLRACGVWVRDFGTERAALESAGRGVSLRSPDGALDCGNSATTMRLLMGAIAGEDCNAVLDGDGSLRTRPMERVAEPLRAMGAHVSTASGGVAPVQVQGLRRLRGIEWASPVASAQLKSAVLLAGLSAEGATSLVEPALSRDHTERMLRACGVSVRSDGTRVTVMPASPQPFGMRVPGDISSAAFFLCLAAARDGWRACVREVGLNPGRTGVLDVLQAMGARVVVESAGESGGEPHGSVEVRGAGLRATVIEGPLSVRCIDELPVIAVLATQARGETVVRDAAELRRKESDRIARLVEGLRSFGAACDATQDGFVVSGPSVLHAARVDSHRDHRLAMAFAIAAALSDPATGASVITGSEAAAVSHPAFFAELATVTAPESAA